MAVTRLVPPCTDLAGVWGWGRGPPQRISRRPTVINRSPMRIDQVVGQGKPTISFEFFPPKNEAGFQALYKSIDELHPLHPTYVSVTYGAGGSGGRKPVELVAKIQNELRIRAMAHLTCVGHTADELGGILDDLHGAGIINVLALRGDPPAGPT